MKALNYDANKANLATLEALKPKYAFDPALPFGEQSVRALEKLRELLGMDNFVKPKDAIEWGEEKLIDGIRHRDFAFLSEENVWVPCRLLLPEKQWKNLPLVICIQGHASGMHISFGEPHSEDDAASIAGGRDYAVQAVRHGYAAIALEQRSFGLRENEIINDNRCNQASMTALLLGRTMIGERVWDVQRLIDTVESFMPMINTGNIVLTGNSGGGTVTIYAACIEKRILVAAPSCSMCTYKASIAAMAHCTCNYIPGIARWFDMGDLAQMIAPRPLLVMAGREDPIFPLPGVRECEAVIKKVYEAAEVPDRFILAIGEGGHRYYPECMWDNLEILENKIV